MDSHSPAVHRTVVAIDVEGFGGRHRTNRNQMAVREGLYRAMQEACLQAGIPWAHCDHEDRGDGMLILAGPEAPKSLFVERLPSALVSALQGHNATHPEAERIRLRMALHAGEVNYDEYGVTSAAVNMTFRMLECGPAKEALAGSPGVLAVITSSWFFEEVVRHSRTDAGMYHPISVTVKETNSIGWICLPDHRVWPGPLMRDRSSGAVIPASDRAEEDPVDKFRKVLSLAYGLDGLFQAIAVSRIWDSQRKGVRLWRNDGACIPQISDIFEIYSILSDAEACNGISVARGHDSFMMQRGINFAPTVSESIMAHNLAPLVSAFPASSYVFVILDDGRVISAIHALIAALYDPYRDDTAGSTAHLDLAYVVRELTQDSDVERDNSFLKAALGVIISAVEQGTAPSGSLEPLAELIGSPVMPDTQLTELFTRLERLLPSTT